MDILSIRLRRTVVGSGGVVRGSSGTNLGADQQDDDSKLPLRSKIVALQLKKLYACRDMHVQRKAGPCNKSNFLRRSGATNALRICTMQYVHTCPRAYFPTCILAHAHIFPRAYLPTCIAFHAHSCHVHTCSRAYFPTCVLAHVHTCPCAICCSCVA